MTAPSQLSHNITNNNSSYKILQLLSSQPYHNYKLTRSIATRIRKLQRAYMHKATSSKYLVMFVMP